MNAHYLFLGGKWLVSILLCLGHVELHWGKDGIREGGKQGGCLLYNKVLRL